MNSIYVSSIAKQTLREVFKIVLHFINVHSEQNRKVKEMSYFLIKR